MTKRQYRELLALLPEGVGITDLDEKGVSTTGGGFGLYLSKRVVEGYGGSIELIPKEQGTVYRILLPTS